MSLQDQGERNFQDPFFRDLLKHDLSIRTSTNEPDPCRGLHGFVTTYQALGMQGARALVREFRARSYILVLDEFHHVEEGGIWHRALRPLVDHARYLILMTGTLERGDGRPIAFMRYEGASPVVDGDLSTVMIEYGRRAALEEGAILPLHFSLSDGKASWEKDGHEYSVDSLSEMNPIFAGPAIMSALNTDLGFSILDDCLASWREERARGYEGARLLAVTADYTHAKKIHSYLRDERGIRSVEIATSHNPEQAARAILRYKRGEIEVLVTIAMAYEGLDCPPISHIACLTHIRSVPWIEQMCARAVRIDPAGPDRQIARVFAPDDVLFRSVVERIRSEQLPVLTAMAKEPVQESLFGSEGEGGLRPKITPLGSAFQARREVMLGSEHVRTPTEIQEELLRRIESHVRRYAFDNHYDVKRLNAEIKGVFGKARPDMTNAELKRALDYVRSAYPLGYGVTASVESGSRPRAKRPRVPTKAVPWEGRGVSR
jgi:hypothetical protein